MVDNKDLVANYFLRRLVLHYFCKFLEVFREKNVSKENTNRHPFLAMHILSHEYIAMASQIIPIKSCRPPTPPPPLQQKDAK